MKDQRKERIRTLKQEIKTKQEEQLEIIKDFDLVAVQKLPEEEQKVQKKEWQDKIQIKKFELENAAEELKQLRMNKTGSKFFEFIPTLANRRQRRLYRKMRRL